MEKERPLSILQLSNKSPFPASEGGPMAMHAVIEAWLHQGYKVDVLTMDTPKFSASEGSIPASWRGRIGFSAVWVDSSIKSLGVIFNLISPQSYLASRFRSTAYAQELRRLLTENTYDIVQLESPMLACYLPLIRSLSKARLVLRAHNIEHRIWERIASNQTNPLRRAYLRLQSRRLKRLELSVWKDVEGIAAITEKDAADIRIFTGRPVRGIPFGVQLPQQQYKPVNAKSLAFIGSMDWMPNLEGISWFIEKVWPRIVAEDEGIRLYLAGRNFPEHLNKLESRNIFGLGEVDDALEFICSNSLVIVPLLSGSGIRIKIIEAMSAACPVLSTTLGCEGIAARSGKEIHVADTAETFARSCLTLLNDEATLIRTGQEARELIRQRYSIESTATAFGELYQSLK